MDDISVLPLKYLAISENATAYVTKETEEESDDDQESGRELETLFKLKGNSVHKTYLDYSACLLYTSPSPRDRQKSRMPSSA